jgi:hypothetical protein
MVYRNILIVAIIASSLFLLRCSGEPRKSDVKKVKNIVVKENIDEQSIVISQNMCQFCLGSIIDTLDSKKIQKIWVISRDDEYTNKLRNIYNRESVKFRTVLHSSHDAQPLLSPTVAISSADSGKTMFIPPQKWSSLKRANTAAEYLNGSYQPADSTMYLLNNGQYSES